jgi:choline dehydrogenase-like flavoprotein
MEQMELNGSDWDAVIVGTGMGGATIGYALARAGWRVLFCEKGRSALGNSSALRGAYAEASFSSPGVIEQEVLRAAGRYSEPICDLSQKKERRFIPFIGCGTGGSSALYGMVLERFLPADFTPRANYSSANGSTLPDRWPIAYANIEPYYAQAERLYGVSGGRDPLRQANDPADGNDMRPLSASARELIGFLEGQGLHPYRLPLACERSAACQGCQGYLCQSGCKHDSAGTCLEPAIGQFGATMLDECNVVKIEASRERVTGLVCRRRAGTEFRVTGRVVVLAAGALATPFLLLSSKSAEWPEGLANGSGLVGRNLMRHYVDLYAVFPKARQAPGENAKEFGCNDFYLDDEGKFGAIQSFGRLPPASMLVEDLQRDIREEVHPLAAAAFGIVKPVVRPVLDQLFGRSTILATILEDLPYLENRVHPPRSADPERLAITYRLRGTEAARVAKFRQRMRTLLKPYRPLLIKQAESNQRIAHACGTCRFGDDPRTSVLDAHNRAHGLANLYVVDASFFPSSGGTNPALTIAANALRVADHLTGQRNRGPTA